VAILAVRKLRMEIQHLRLPLGVEGTYGCIRHPGASLAVPVLEDGRVVLLRQYRFAVQQRILEFPAGTLEIDEQPQLAIERELQEEAGYLATRWDSLGLLLPCPGYSDEVIHLFLARGLQTLPTPVAADQDEDLEVLLFTPTELDAAFASGDEPLDGKSVTAWFRARQLLGFH
jgi:ADP-ribose pyrophosphatase